MKNVKQSVILLLIFVSVLFASCSAGKNAGKNNCGCNLNKGFVGY